MANKSQIGSLADVMAAQANEYAAADLGTVSSNITLVSGGVSRFAVHYPVWESRQGIDEEPAREVACEGFLDLTKGHIGLTSASAFAQPKGGRAAAEEAIAAGAEPVMQTQMQFGIVLSGAKIGVFDSETGDPILHFFHTAESLESLRIRELEISAQSPFDVSTGLIEVIRQTLLAAGWEATSYDPQNKPGGSSRQQFFNLAPKGVDAARGASRVRKAHTGAFPVAEVVVQGPRRNSEVRIGNRVLPPEHDFVYNLTEQLRYGKLLLAEADNPNDPGVARYAYSMVTMVSGVDHAQGQAKRSTINSISYDHAVPGRMETVNWDFWEARNAE